MPNLSSTKLAEMPAGKHSDGDGLYLLVKPSGSRSWVFMYKYRGKRFERGLGPLKTVNATEARRVTRSHRAKLDAGINPFPSEAPEDAGPVMPYFSEVAMDYIEDHRATWKNEKHGQQWENTLKQHAPGIWKMPVDQVTTTEVLAALRPIWTTKAETASRVRSRIEIVLNAAKAVGHRSGENPAQWKGHLKNILPTNSGRATKHHAAMPYSQVPGLMAELRTKERTGARALEFTILTAKRVSEVVNATWGEFDLKQKLWVIPGQRMKAGVEHREPLTDQAIKILMHMQLLGRPGPFPISNMAMSMQMRRMGYDDYTVHGFRSSFRDWVGEETDFAGETAEIALAHVVGSKVERAYRRADALEKRRNLMEAWAGYVTQPVGQPETDPSPLPE